MMAIGFVLFVIGYFGVKRYMWRPYTKEPQLFAFSVVLLLGFGLMLFGFALWLWEVFP